MATDRKTEPKLAEAAAKTTAVLQSLQSRLNRDTPPVETRDELGEELQNYFATERASAPQLSNGSDHIPIPGEIRAQVIDGVVNKILGSWGDANGQVSASIKSEVIGRLVEHVLADLLKKRAGPK